MVFQSRLLFYISFLLILLHHNHMGISLIIHRKYHLLYHLISLIMVILQLYKELMQDANVIQLLNLLRLSLALHKHYIKMLMLLYQHLKKVLLHKEYIFRLSLDPYSLNLVLNDLHVVLNHNQFYQQCPIILPIQKEMQILYLSLLYYRIPILLLNRS